MDIEDRKILEKTHITGDIDILISAISEKGNIDKEMLVMLYLTTPDYLKPGKIADLKETLQRIERKEILPG